MELNQVLLKQAEEALWSAHHAYLEVMRSVPMAVPKSNQILAEDRPRRARKGLHSRLSVLIPITSMYAAQYADETHRCTRVADLLVDYCSEHHAFQHAFIAFTKKIKVEYSKPWYRQFQKAGSMLELVQMGLMQVGQTVSKPERLPGEDAMDTEEERNEECNASDPKKGTLLKSSQYLRKRTRFENKLEALSLVSCAAPQRLDEIIVEKLDLPFQRFLVTQTPIYPEVKQYIKEANGNVDEEPEYIVSTDFDFINAMWASMLAKGSMDDRKLDSYGTMYLAANGMIPGKATALSDTHSLCYLNPMTLAKNLRGIDIVLGIIFESDPTVVVWPVGKSKTDKEFEVIVYCVHYEHCGDMFQYEGIEVLESGQRVTRAPRIDRAFSSVHFNYMTWWDRRSYRSIDLRLGPFEPGFLHSIMTIAKQSLLGWKPFPFLRLPAELRNKVYEEYLAHVDTRLKWTTSCVFNARFDLPELCQTGHQLLSEVLPLYLEKRPVEVIVPRRLPRTTLGRQPLLRGLLLFKKIDFYVIGGPGIHVEIDTEQNRFGVEFKFRSTPSASHIGAQAKIESLLEILVNDTRTDGFGPAEISVIIEFLCDRKEYLAA